MTMENYIKDHILMILLHLFCMLCSSCYFLTCGVKKNQLMLFYIAWAALLAVYLVQGWFRRRRYFGEIFRILEQLDKPYLIAEVMPATLRLEDQLYKEVLRLSNKSVIDAVHELEVERQEYQEFIENWIHEVKLPLTAMNLICDNHKNEQTRRIKPYLAELENDVEKALFYARSDTVYQDYLVHEISLREAVLSSVQRLRAYLIQNQVQVEISLGTETVYCDEKWLEFILNQLFLNAVKYKKEEGCLIQVTARKEESRTLLTVEDHGVGMKESEIGRIFEKGFTGTNGRMKEEEHHQPVWSTGIGLYLCRKLSGKLGMDIRAESKEGEFTRMILSFPDGGSYFSRGR